MRMMKATTTIENTKKMEMPKTAMIIENTKEYVETVGWLGNKGESMR